MNDQEWAERLRAGIGGPNLRALRKLTAAATALDFIAVGRKMSRPLADEKMMDATDAIGFLLQMAGELTFASGRLLAEDECYAGAALLRQMSEIEYLTW